MPDAPTLPVLVEVRRLVRPPLPEGLSFDVRPGLTFVRGGEGRGKTTLLRLLAGELAPASGTCVRHARTVWHATPADPAHDAMVTREWLQARRATLPAWHEDVAQALSEAFQLVPHLDKPMFMLSAGTRRKVGLVGAAASRADLVLLECPFAALDARSRAVLGELLAEAAAGTRQAWVLADHERPAALDDLPLAATVDLGD